MDIEVSNLTVTRAVSSRIVRRAGQWSRALALACLFVSFAVSADPQVDAGDAELRHDLEYLADRQLLSIPISTWPISWAEISQAIESIDKKMVRSPSTNVVISRIKNRLMQAMQISKPTLTTRASLSDNNAKLRGFRNVPREKAEIEAALSYVGDAFATKLQVNRVGSPQDNQSVRFDGSYLSYLWKNVAVTAGYQDRWWGPGQLGSLILSNNARPVPGLSIKRHVAFQSKHILLRWMGPWSAHAFAGRLESDRFVSSPYLLGARVVIKPHPSFELGVSRTAQWGGDGRPTSFDSLINLVLGRDNQGEGISREEEPGNQMAGFDGRFSYRILNRPATFYFQLIGEDEAGGFPSRYLGQFGVSTSIPVKWRSSSLRVSAEFSDTTCQFNESSRIYDCAYNNSLYRSGYRYRSRAIGHSTDNDSRQVALLATLTTSESHNWSVALRIGDLNRGGITPDLANSVSSVPRGFAEVEVVHTRPFMLGKLDVGLGLMERELSSTGKKTDDINFFLSWTS